MKVLVLSPYPEGLLAAFDSFLDEFEVTSSQIDCQYCLDNRFDFLVSYGYRYILKQDLLDLFPCRAVNLNISLLPYCRGAHPVLWSIMDGHPFGVTIHMLDQGLDTGNILFQHATPTKLMQSDSFATVYSKLRLAIETLFVQNWKYIRTSECSGWEQQGLPTLHYSRELEQCLQFMPQGWSTPISVFCKLASLQHPLLLSEQSLI